MRSHFTNLLSSSQTRNKESINRTKSFQPAAEGAACPHLGHWEDLAGQGWVGQGWEGKTWQGWAGQGRSGKGWAGKAWLGRAGLVRPGRAGLGQAGKAWLVRAGQVRAGQRFPWRGLLHCRTQLSLLVCLSAKSSHTVPVYETAEALSYRNQLSSTKRYAVFVEQFPDHRHRNLNTFREHIQTHVDCCVIAY